MNILRNLSPEQHNQVEAFFHEHVHDNIQKEFHEVVGKFLQGTLPLVQLMEKLVAILGWHPTHKLLHFIREELKIPVDESVQKLMDSLKPSNIAAQVLSKRFKAGSNAERPKKKRKETKESKEESTSGRRRSKSTHWTQQENDLLAELVVQYPKEEYSNQWALIAAHFPSRDQAQCYQHWHRVLRPGIKKGPWTVEEEELLTELVEKGTLQNKKVSWAKIALDIEGRVDTSCRYMWNQILRSRAAPWKQLEDIELLHIVSIQGEEGLDWNRIAQSLHTNLKEHNTSCRTALDCKKRFFNLTGTEFRKSNFTANTESREKPVAKKPTTRKGSQREEEMYDFPESESDEWTASSDSE